MTKQMAAVKRTLDDERVPIHAVLCFTGSEWSLLAEPFTVDGVLVTWPKALVGTISSAADGYINVSRICAGLSTQFPIARRHA